MSATELYNQQKRQWILRGRHGTPPLNLPTSLSDFERQIIYGSMLGDGGTNYTNKYPDRNECYTEKHSIAQQEYLKWKIANCFHKWMKNPDKLDYIKAQTHLLEKREVKGGPLIRFWTSYCPMFTFLGHKWYKRKADKYILDDEGERIKHLPRDLIEVMSSKENYGLGLAIWLMDDGSYNPVKGSKSFYIEFSTQSFSKKENDILCDDLLWGKFGVSGVVRPIGDKFRIQLTASGSRKFLYIVKPWVEGFSEMKYKVGIGKPPESTDIKKPEMHYIMKFDDGKMTGIRKVSKNPVKARNYAEALMRSEGK